jgi:hypothetical protein
MEAVWKHRGSTSGPEIVRSSSHHAPVVAALAPLTAWLPVAAGDEMPDASGDCPMTCACAACVLEGAVRCAQGVRRSPQPWDVPRSPAERPAHRTAEGPQGLGPSRFVGRLDG